MLINNKNGFTLVELLVVISIIAVLSAVLMANFMGARERARDAQKIQDLSEVKNALRMYYNDHQSYPLTGTNLSGVLVPTYIGSVLGYKSYTSTGDEFKLSVGLEAGAGNEDTDSQVKCGIGTTENKVFTVCAN